MLSEYRHVTVKRKLSGSARVLDQGRFGPYCRALNRGAVSDGAIDGRSRPGRFLRRIEGELLAQIGPAPSFAQKLLVRRISRMMLRLELFEQQLDDGTLSDFSQKIYGALSNHVRLGLRDLGLKPRAPKQPSLSDVLARHDTRAPAP
jgi:hypothetical protein